MTRDKVLTCRSITYTCKVYCMYHRRWKKEIKIPVFWSWLVVRVGVKNLSWNPNKKARELAEVPGAGRGCRELAEVPGAGRGCWVLAEGAGHWQRCQELAEGAGCWQRMLGAGKGCRPHWCAPSGWRLWDDQILVSTMQPQAEHRSHLTEQILMTRHKSIKLFTGNKCISVLSSRMNIWIQNIHIQQG